MCNQPGIQHKAKKISLFTLAILTTLAMLMPTFQASAETINDGTVEWDFNGRTAWVGEPFLIKVNVVNAGEFTNPVVPPIDGITTRIVPGNQESTFTQIINGRVTTRSTRSLVIELTPEREGIFEIPPISMTVDGVRHTSEMWKFFADTSQTGDLMHVDVIGTPGSGYVGQAIRLTLLIWIKVYTNANERVTLSEADTWSLINTDKSEWGIFEKRLRELTQQNKRLVGQEVTRQNETYYVYQLQIIDHPVKSGEIDPGTIRVSMEYPEEISRQQRGRGIFFNRNTLEITRSRPINTPAKIEPPISIKPLPLKGRPKEFTGAVGQYRVRATAQPTTASVGDPITLIYEVTDESQYEDADLANLRPPALRDLPALEGFRIPDDPTTGIVDGRTKIFTETLRPTDPNITEIPSIPFVAFNPELGNYVTVRSKPIPIAVSPSETLNLDSVMPFSGEANRRDRGPQLTLVEGNLRANAPLSLAMMSERSNDPTAWLVAASVAPPLGFAATMLWQRRKRLHLERPDIVRASSAKRTAMAILSGEGELHDRVFDSITGIIAARMHLPSGTLTSSEAIEILSGQTLDEAVIQELKSILTCCETARYASGESDTADLETRTRRLLSVLDRIRPLRKGVTS